MLSGNSFKLRARPNELVSALMKRIAARAKFDVSRLLILHDGVELDGSVRVEQSGLTGGAVIHVGMKLRGGGKRGQGAQGSGAGDSEGDRTPVVSTDDEATESAEESDHGAEDGTPSIELAENLLHSVFKREAFRPGQRELVDGLCNGMSALFAVPTGGGKSLLFQMLGAMEIHCAAAGAPATCTIIISPYLALSSDQVRAVL